MNFFPVVVGFRKSMSSQTKKEKGKTTRNSLVYRSIKSEQNERVEKVAIADMVIASTRWRKDRLNFSFFFFSFLFDRISPTMQERRPDPPSSL